MELRRSPRHKCPLLTLDAAAYAVIVNTLTLTDISALVLGVGKLMSSFVLQAAEQKIEAALLAQNHAPLTALENLRSRHPPSPACWGLHVQTFPLQLDRRATALLEARALLTNSGLESMESPSGFSLAGIYTHGEAFGAQHGYEYENSILLSLPDRRGHSCQGRPRTCGIGIVGFEP